MTGKSTDELVIRIDERVGTLTNHMSVIEERLTAIEKWPPRLIGMATAVSVILAIDIVVRFIRG